MSGGGGLNNGTPCRYLDETRTLTEKAAIKLQVSVLGIVQGNKVALKVQLSVVGIM
ncbi:hypothetical protein [Cohnella pontilimi]|uniref:hypothetical protein n=1 Tax=Cohnella pontilimi TaxID=2564100 RepID=UPI00145DA2EF|nr:hypothetical protein [Cohnella pontilimi]